MLRKSIIVLSLASAAIADSPALPQQGASTPGTDCRVRVDATPTSWVIRGYDPYDATAPEGTFSVTYSNEGTRECRFVPTFDLDRPPFGLATGTGHEVGYALLDITNSVDVTPRAGRGRNPAALKPMVLGAGQSAVVLYRLIVAPDDVTDSGLLVEDVTLEAQDENLRVVGGARVVLGLEVLPSARIGLAGAYTLSNGQANVSLGELREGPAPVPLQLRVSSTGRYDLDVSSLNGGRLQLGDSGWQIPYSVTIGGEAIDLSGSDTISGPVDRGLTRTALPIQFVIGEVSNRRAGVYSDVISISVSAR